MPLQSHFDVTSISLRVHSRFTLMAHRFRFGFIPDSLEFEMSSVFIWNSGLFVEHNLVEFDSLNTT